MKSDQLTCGNCGHVSTSPIQVGIYMSVSKSDVSCKNCGQSIRLDTTIVSDLKFDEATNIKFDNPTPLKSPAIEGVHKSFSRNVERVHSLGNLPTMTMHSWILWADNNQKSRLADEMQASVPNVEKLFSKVPNEGTYIGIESILSSMLLGAWTAFETLAGDLWEVALNENPRLALLSKNVQTESKKIDLNLMRDLRPR